MDARLFSSTFARQARRGRLRPARHIARSYSRSNVGRPIPLICRSGGQVEAAWHFNRAFVRAQSTLNQTHEKTSSPSSSNLTSTSAPRSAENHGSPGSAQASPASTSPPLRLTDRPDSHSSEGQVEKRDEPAYDITFTCKPCLTRSTHRISKQGYHRGTILITCPSCKNKHLISDHLRIFDDKSITIEDILREKGSELKKGAINPDGDIEFWDNPVPNTKASESGT